MLSSRDSATRSSDSRPGTVLLPALINDEQLVETFKTSLEDASGSLEGLEQLMAKLEEGDGLLPKLINDEELGTEVTDQLRELLGRLNGVTEELQEGDGSAAQLINDPAIYEALNDIVVGINEFEVPAVAHQKPPEGGNQESATRISRRNLPDPG